MPSPQDPFPSPEPFSPASGLYANSKQEFRLDVDGRYPQMAASGNFTHDPNVNNYWVATELVSSETYPHNYWKGRIRYRKRDDINFPFDKVEIWLSDTAPDDNPSGSGPSGVNPRKAYVRFGEDKNSNIVSLPFVSEYFRQVNFEFDYTVGAKPVTAVDNQSFQKLKSSQSPDLIKEDLSVQAVFKNAGFEVIKSPGSQKLGEPPTNPWTNKELHDFMIKNWSQADRLHPSAKWAVWILCTSLHKDHLTGIMFDSVGDKNCGYQLRQGCALFYKKVIKDVWDPEIRVQQKFYTACHEIGHCFNLPHSEDPMSGPSWISRWNWSAGEPNALSFMRGSTSADGPMYKEDWKKFRFRFSGYDRQADNECATGRELLFLRHAPESFVEPGGKDDLYDDPNLLMPHISPEPNFNLQLKTNSGAPDFEYMEPVILELQLTNISGRPQKVDKEILSSPSSRSVIIKKKGDTAYRIVLPYARYCWTPDEISLGSGKWASDSFFASAGLNGWKISDPGEYTIQVILHMNGEDIPSNLLPISVQLPVNSSEDTLSQDYFSEDVARILTFGGSRVLERGNNVLRRVSEMLPYQRVALHASVALGLPLASDYNILDEVDGRLQLKISPADQGEAKKLLTSAFELRKNEAIKTLGGIMYNQSLKVFKSLGHVIGGTINPPGGEAHP